jgi:hypothetical protein
LYDIVSKGNKGVSWKARNIQTLIIISKILTNFRLELWRPKKLNNFIFRILMIFYGDWFLKNLAYKWKETSFLYWYTFQLEIDQKISVSTLFLWNRLMINAWSRSSTYSISKIPTFPLDIHRTVYTTKHFLCTFYI